MEPQNARENAPGAVSSLVLGILGLVLCPILSPFAWSTGASAAKTAQEQHYGGEGLATAGKILGIVGTVLLVIGIIGLIIVLATDDGTSFNDEFGLLVIQTARGLMPG